MAQTQTLTPRQREIVLLVARGYTSRAVARELYISVSTVKRHVEAAMRATGAHSRAHLVAMTLREDRVPCVPEQHSTVQGQAKVAKTEGWSWEVALLRDPATYPTVLTTRSDTR